MIVAIGIDIIEVARIGEVLQRTLRFQERIFNGR
jgi:phosphopantetheinyl transferase (holo-ACP synthase)